MPSLSWAESEELGGVTEDDIINNNNKNVEDKLLNACNRVCAYIIEYTSAMASALDTFSQHCRQEADTATLAQSLAHILSQYLLGYPSQHLNLALEGDLGAGKTTFARYLIQGIGYVGRVKSPTYTLCEPYPLQLSASPVIEITAHHFDLYRMRTPHEWQEAGFAEYFDVPGFCLIEWPEKAEGTLPPMDIQISLSSQSDSAETSRDITFSAHTVAGNTLLARLVTHIQAQTR